MVSRSRRGPSAVRRLLCSFLPAILIVCLNFKRYLFKCDGQCIWTVKKVEDWVCTEWHGIVRFSFLHLAACSYCCHMAINFGNSHGPHSTTLGHLSFLLLFQQWSFRCFKTDDLKDTIDRFCVDSSFDIIDNFFIINRFISIICLFW